ncbi:HNH endonuclease [Sphingomonas aerolata]|uniref:HNH endonuclease n=1 Tax=Sphingomonas aerolata TaxID=185951 RepID=UPI00141AF62C|nr:HNH endonuclease [Sphingomonas aerolata]NII58879.1 5-methylcytosine-specific restriction protein A [Sphingomonas aerolata]
MALYCIGPDNAEPYDARIEVEGSSIILHSRGGSTGGRPARNTQYAHALEAICKGAAQNPGVLRRVLIDSRPARTLQEQDRILVEEPELSTLDLGDLVRTIRSRALRFNQAEGATGGNATKQIRLDFTLPSHSIITSLRLKRWASQKVNSSDSHAHSRLPAAIQRTVTTLHIRNAVDRLLSGENAPQFAGSREYDVIVEGGHRLAPKKVFGLALEAALGIKMTPRHFSAGLGEPCFELLEAAGYRIVEKAEGGTEGPLVQVEPLAVPIDDEEQGWAEGSQRLVKHFRTERRRDPRAAAEKRRKVRAANSGRLACENPACTTDWYTVFPETIAEAVFEVHHTTAVADMTPNHITTVDDLRCLCAACHRAEHRRIALGQCGG